MSNILGACLDDHILVQLQKPDSCAQLPEAEYIVLVVTVDFTSGTVDKHVNIRPDGPWRKTAAKTLTSLLDNPYFSEEKEWREGKKVRSTTCEMKGKQCSALF